MSWCIGTPSRLHGIVTGGNGKGDLIDDLVYRYTVGYDVGGRTNGDRPGWVVSEGIIDLDGVHTPDQQYFEWISSMYWAITTMSTIGYGAASNG